MDVNRTNDTTAAIIHLNTETKSIEVMVTNLQEFTPIIHCGSVMTLEQLKNLTRAHCEERVLKEYQVS